MKKTTYNNIDRFLIPIERHADIKLTPEKVEELIKLKGIMRPREAGKRFGVSKQRVWQVWNPEKYEQSLMKKKERDKKYGAIDRAKYKEKYARYRRNYKHNRDISYAIEAKKAKDNEALLEKVGELTYACNYRKITQEEFFLQVHDLLYSRIKKYYIARSEERSISLWDLVQ